MFKAESVDRVFRSIEEKPNQILPERRQMWRTGSSLSKLRTLCDRFAITLRTRSRGGSCKRDLGWRVNVSMPSDRLRCYGAVPVWHDFRPVEHSDISRIGFCDPSNMFLRPIDTKQNHLRPGHLFDTSETLFGMFFELTSPKTDRTLCAHFVHRTGPTIYSSRLTASSTFPSKTCSRAVNPRVKFPNTLRTLCEHFVPCQPLPYWPLPGQPIANTLRTICELAAARNLLLNRFRSSYAVLV